MCVQHCQRAFKTPDDRSQNRDVRVLVFLACHIKAIYSKSAIIVLRDGTEPNYPGFVLLLPRAVQPRYSPCG